MPFAALIGGVLGAALFSLAHTLGMLFHGGLETDGWMYLYVLPISTAAAFGWTFVWIACAVAPTGKVITGAIMTTLLVVGSVTYAVVVWVGGHTSIGEEIKATVGCLACSVAAIACVFQTHDKHGEKRYATS